MEILTTTPGFINSLPKLPGVYRFFTKASQENAAGELLYVGKALNLYSRVKSYFQKSTLLSPRISLMISKIHRIEITITDSEVSALILESNLIKSLKPKYNIIFRDDKSYPFIRLTNHQFPKLDSFRGKPNSRDICFGPYPSAFAVKENLDTLSRLFKLRTCVDSVFNNRSRPCMLYQIKRCSAPCVNLVSKADYNQQVASAIDFLQGKYAKIIADLTAEMYALSDNMEFEQAAKIRDKLAMLKQISEAQIINNYQKPFNADLIFGEKHSSTVFIYLIILRNGLYIGDKHFTLNNIDNPLVEVIEAFLENYYLETQHVHNIFTSVELSAEFKRLFSQASGIEVQYKVNQQIEHLHQLGMVNLHKIVEQQEQVKTLENAAGRLAQLLGMPPIKRIECIDISHNHGENTIGSLVVYENGIIDHSKYRRYNLDKDYEGAAIKGNDLLAMETLLKRRLVSKELNVPEVIVVDGGPLQLKTLKNMLVTMGLCDKIRGIAIYKGEGRKAQNDSILLDNGDTLECQNDGQLFGLLQSLRDEAHRFAITGHRKKQIKKMTRSNLNEIPNLGVKKQRALIAYFGSVKGIAVASISELQKVAGVGEKLAGQIYLHFH